jgi:hypothetical protein
MKKLSILKAGSLTAILIVGAVVGIMFSFQMNDVIVEQISGVPSRHWGALGDATLASGTSGFMYYMHYPHQAVPGTAYHANLSNATAYEYRDSLNGEMTKETPYNTAYDYVCKFRVNTTVGYNSSGSKWMDSWVRAYITVNFDYRADVANTSMTIIQIVNTSTYAWYHAYYNNGGAGFQLTKNEKDNATVLVQGYY